MREEDLHETLRAIRELAHSSCYLANLASRLTRDAKDPDALAASHAALEASTQAAESAFTLDDALRTEMDAAAILWLSLETLEVAQRAVRLAREAVEAALALTMGGPVARASRTKKQ